MDIVNAFAILLIATGVVLLVIAHVIGRDDSEDDG